MNKIKSVNESKFWKIVSEVNWGSDFDYTRIKLELMKTLTPKAQDEYAKIYYNMHFILNSKIHSFCDENRIKMQVGDDSLNDLVAHIIGLGKAEFDKVMDYPGLALNRGQKKKYEECFSYSVPFREDRESASKDKYILKAKEYLESEEIVNFLNLSKKKKEAISERNDVNVEKRVNKLVAGLQEVASGNLNPLDIPGFDSRAQGDRQLSSSELYQAWKSVNRIFDLHWDIPNLINDYNEFKDLIS